MKTKTKVSLKDLIKKMKFNWVNSDITPENFPQEDIRSSDYKLYHFDKYITSENAVAEMQKEGYQPANIYELLSWKDWNGKDFVVGLGSSCALSGRRFVPCLHDWDGRHLNLVWWDGGWYGFYRFLAVRASSLETKPSGTVALSPSDTLQKAIDEVKKAGYKVIKEM